MHRLVFVLVVACGGRAEPVAPVRAPAPPPSVRPDAPAAPEVIGVALAVTPPAAHVMIDDVDRGAASELPAVVPLEPGLHSIVITHEGYKPFRVEFAVSNKTERITVRLDPAR